jgi:hypothetical protein
MGVKEIFSFKGEFISTNLSFILHAMIDKDLYLSNKISLRILPSGYSFREPSGNLTFKIY